MRHTLRAASPRSIRALREVLTELSTPTKKPLTPEPLTPRELDILRLVAQGRSNKQIAEELCITEMTVRTHISNILAKLHLASRTPSPALRTSKGLLLSTRERPCRSDKLNLSRIC